MLHNYTYIFLYNVYYNENIALHVYVRIFPSMFITPLSPPRLFFQGKIRNFAMRPGFLAFDVCGSSCPFLARELVFFCHQSPRSRVRSTFSSVNLSDHVLFLLLFLQPKGLICSLSICLIRWLRNSPC